MPIDHYKRFKTLSKSVNSKFDVSFKSIEFSRRRCLKQNLKIV